MPVPNTLAAPRGFGILADPGAFATTMLVAVIDLFGTEAISEEEAWTPSTFKMELEALINRELPSENIDKLMAGIMLVTTDFFWNSRPHFVTLCNVLSGDDFEPEQVNPADVREMAWGITEARLLDPPEADNPFAEEIRHYIAAQLQQEGFVTAPPLLQQAMGSDVTNDISADFSDDPDLFEALTVKRQADSDDVTAMIRQNLLAMAQQLSLLPLENGSAKALVDRINQRLKGP